MASLHLARARVHIQRGRDLVGLGQSLGAMTNGLVDSSDLYRAALVQAVAAIDFYFHQIVLDRAVDSLMGRGAAVSHSAVGALSLSDVYEILEAQHPADRELSARRVVAERLGRETLQRPDAIASAMSLVGLAKIWSVAFADAERAKTALNVIVTRRNSIVHACDADPVSPGGVTHLSDADALAALDTAEVTLTAVDARC